MRKPVLPACLLLLICGSSAFAADVVILRDGKRRTGKLQSYVDGRFRLTGKAIERELVAWVGFDQKGDAVPPQVKGSADAVVLLDGTTVAGELEGVTLGDVGIGGETFERDEVAWIRILDAQGVAEAPVDDPGGVLVDDVLLRSGGHRTGSLIACVSSACTLESESPIGRDDIAAIGIGSKAPSESASDEDVILLADGGRKVARVHGINPVEIVSASGVFPRASVRGVLFAIEEDPPAGGAFGAPSGGAPGATGDSPMPSRPNTSAPPPSAPPRTTNPGPMRIRDDGSIENGALWTGMVHGINTTYVNPPDRPPYTQVHRATIHVKMRETVAHPIVDRARKVSTYRIELVSEGTKIQASWAQPGCSDQSSTTYSDGPGDVPSGHMQYTTGNAPAPWANYPVAGEMALRFIAPTSWTACAGTPGESQHNYGVGSYVSIGNDLASVEAGRDHRPLSENRSAFKGQYTFGKPNDTGSWKTEVRWNICRQGNNSCTPIPEFDFDPCGRSGQQRALASACRSQLDALIRDLVPHQEQFSEYWDTADRHKFAYVRAIAVCKVYDLVKKTLERILTANAAGLGETGKALQYLKKVLEATAKGDLKSFLIPEEMKAVIGAMNDISSFGRMLSSDVATLLGDQLNECSGKAVTQDFLDGQKFVSNLKAAMDLYTREISPRLNDIRAKALECEDLQNLADRVDNCP